MARIKKRRQLQKKGAARVDATGSLWTSRQRLQWLDVALVPQGTHGRNARLHPRGRVGLAEVVDEPRPTALRLRCQLNGHDEVGGVTRRGQHTLGRNTGWW